MKIVCMHCGNTILSSQPVLETTHLVTEEGKVEVKTYLCDRCRMVTESVVVTPVAS